MLRAGNAYIEMFEYSVPGRQAGRAGPAVCDHGYTHFCLDVRDIDAEYERLLGRRHALPLPPTAASDCREGRCGPPTVATPTATSSSCWRSSTTAIPCSCRSCSTLNAAERRR